MNDREKWQEGSGISVLPARHDDDDINMNISGIEESSNKWLIAASSLKVNPSIFILKCLLAFKKILTSKTLKINYI